MGISCTIFHICLVLLVALMKSLGIAIRKGAFETSIFFSLLISHYYYFQLYLGRYIIQQHLRSDYKTIIGTLKME